VCRILPKLTAAINRDELEWEDTRLAVIEIVVACVLPVARMHETSVVPPDTSLHRAPCVRGQS
jgi:hypothetical protein